MREKSGKRRREEGRKVPLLGPIKKPVSASVSESLLRHSRQLRKHLKAPEKPDNTSLVECRVPPGGHCDFAPCHRDTDLLRASMCRNIATILCIKHRPPSPPSRGGASQPPPFHPVQSLSDDLRMLSFVEMSYFDIRKGKKGIGSNYPLIFIIFIIVTRGIPMVLRDAYILKCNFFFFPFLKRKLYSKITSVQMQMFFIKIC